jgi:hypothetical protein
MNIIEETIEILNSLKSIRNSFINEQENLNIRKINIKRLYEEDISLINNLINKNNISIKEIEETIVETEELLKNLKN